MLQTTRRTVLRSAAWTVPVVTVAAASPAFATSDPDSITFVPGGTSVVPDGDFHGVEFRGASVTIGATALSGLAQLTMTVTFTPTGGDGELFSDLTAPTGWTHQPRTATARNVLVFTYDTAVTAGSIVQISDGTYFGTDDVAQHGSFVLTFEAGGVTNPWISSPTP